jgi:hypothetical protein
VALATPAFSESLIQRNADGSLPRQTPELLAQLVPPMFAALQKALAPLLTAQHGRLQEPAFVQVSVRQHADDGSLGNATRGVSIPTR